MMLPQLVTPIKVAPVAPLPPDRWLGELHPVLVQRADAIEPVLAVGRLSRQPGTRSLLIHAVETASGMEIRHRLSEPDGAWIVLGTLLAGAGWLDLPTRAGAPLRAWVEMTPRKRHAGWNLFRGAAR